MPCPVEAPLRYVRPGSAQGGPQPARPIRRLGLVDVE
jgi:hypothetical protein